MPDDAALTEKELAAAQTDDRLGRIFALESPAAAQCLGELAARAQLHKALWWATDFIRHSQDGRSIKFRQLDVGELADWIIEASGIEP